nr:unnamed protein product [Spirometra erinaceieuropaei]
MVFQLYDGMMAPVTGNGIVSEAFAMTTGVNQACVLERTLFSLMFSAKLMDAYRDERPGIRVAYRTDGHLLNQRRMHFQSSASATFVHELLCADDCTLNATYEVDMQRSMDLFVTAIDNFSLITNMEKLVDMHQMPPNAAYVALHMNANGTQLQAVDNITYQSNSLLATPKSTIKWPTGFPRPAKPSVVCKVPAGIDAVSTSAPNWRCTKQSFCRLCCLERRPGQCTRSRRGNSIISTSAVFDGC